MNPSERIGKGAGRRSRKREDGETPTGGRKGQRDRLKEMEAENAALRARLNMSAPMTVSVWESSGTPKTRAEMAARAYMQEWGDPRRALALLGFGTEDAASPEMHGRILRSPEVLAILDDIMKPVKEQKAAIVARCAQIARMGNDDAAIRAVAQLAKIENWVKPQEAPNVTVSLVQLMNPGAQASAEKRVDAIPSDDVMALLSHEPGAPVRISTGDKSVERALAEVEE